MTGQCGDVVHRPEIEDRRAYGPKRDPGDSRGHSVVESEQPAEPFTPADGADGSDRRVGWEGDHVIEALVVSLAVVVLDKVADDAAQMAFTEGDDVPEAFVLDRANKRLAGALRFGLWAGRRRRCRPAVSRRLRKCVV